MDRITSAEVFVAIVERGSLSAAAEALDMSRAMVTRYLAQMEAWCGARRRPRATRRHGRSPAGAAPPTTPGKGVRAGPSDETGEPVPAWRTQAAYDLGVPAGGG